MARVGRAPRSPFGLSAGDWAAALKRAFRGFLADDCMGLAQQIAYSSLLAFFPAVVFLVGLLDLAGAYVKDFLAPVVPGDVLIALSGLFALYTSFSDSYSKTYGALASGIVLLLWLNYSAFAILFGAELNAELDRQAEIEASPFTVVGRSARDRDGNVPSRRRGARRP